MSLSAAQPRGPWLAILVLLGGAASAEPAPEPVGAMAAGSDEVPFVALGEHSKLGTQDADPLGAGAWQFQLNYGHERSLLQWDGTWESAPREQAAAHRTEAVLTYGASDVLDLAIAVGHAELEDRSTGLGPGSGFTDVVLSAKWRFLEDASRHLAVAFVPALTLPTGNKSTEGSLGPGQEYGSLDLRVAMVKDWSPRWSTNLDVGYEAFFGDRGESLGGLGANLAIGYVLAPWFQPQVEVNYGHDFARVAPDADVFAFTLGAVMPLSDTFCARAGLQHGLVGRHADKLRTFLVSLDVNF